MFHRRATGFRRLLYPANILQRANQGKCNHVARTIIFEQASWIHHCCNKIFILQGLAARWGKVN